MSSGIFCGQDKEVAVEETKDQPVSSGFFSSPLRLSGIHGAPFFL